MFRVDDDCMTHLETCLAHTCLPHLLSVHTTLLLHTYPPHFQLFLSLPSQPHSFPLPPFSRSQRPSASFGNIPRPLQEDLTQRTPSRPLLLHHHQMAPLLFSRQSTTTSNQNDNSATDWWWSGDAYAIKWGIIGGIFVFFLAFFLIGYLHAQSRIRQGRPPHRYHRVGLISFLSSCSCR